MAPIHWHTQIALLPRIRDLVCPLGFYVRNWICLVSDDVASVFPSLALRPHRDGAGPFGPGRW
jgi:hypothetical protein